ncbi:DJ-1/PfpI family protein [bacterium]|nr:DJ-1/PfpI family protein [bacterium]
MQKTVGIFIFNDIEVLDFCGPFEVLSVARVDESKRLDTISPFDVKLIAQTKEPITTTGKMKVIPDYDFESCPKLDILIVPGGMGTRIPTDENEIKEVERWREELKYYKELTDYVIDKFCDGVKPDFKFGHFRKVEGEENEKNRNLKLEI